MTTSATTENTYAKVIDVNDFGVDEMTSTEADIGAIIDVEIVPTLPAYVHLIEEELNREDPNPARIAELMAQDIGLVTRVLRLANSTIYSRSTIKVATIGEAVQRIGIREVRGICLMVALAPMFAVSDPHLNLKMLWKHSLAVALASKVLHRHCPKDIQKQLSTEVLYIAGMLHDIGLIVLAQQTPDAFSEVRRLHSERNDPFCDCERAVLGFSHTDISFMVLQRWNFPDLLTEVAQYHHEYDQAQGKAALHARVIHVADCICNLHGNCDNFEGLAEPYDCDAWNDLGMDESHIGIITEEIDRMMENAEIFALLS
ncbi:MAG: HDOD domain-containing protein [candidate division Zixibacteria bacterium]|nr:HDOD domain-containing protein [candidate division Zixibacteria bacterium]